jgi:hypothetical protein
MCSLFFFFLSFFFLVFFFWSLAANELLKAVQTIPPQNTHCPFLKKKKKERKKNIYFIISFGVWRKISLKSLLFFPSYFFRLLLLPTPPISDSVCVCVSVVKITQTKKMQVVVVFFSVFRPAEIQGGRTLVSNN